MEHYEYKTTKIIWYYKIFPGIGFYFKVFDLLFQFSSTFGGLKRVKLPKKIGAEANRHRGFAFVEFTNESDAKVSIVV